MGPATKLKITTLLGAPANADFHREFTQAILCWQHVESSLYLLFYSLFGVREVQPQTAAIYYAQESFSPKLRLVDAVAKVALKDSRLEAWKKLRSEMESAAKHRNDLAHLTAALEFFPDHSHTFVLTPSVFVPKQLQRKRTFKYNAAGCKALAKLFTDLGVKIEAFTKARAT
jgi:hypothetical protein